MTAAVTLDTSDRNNHELEQPQQSGILDGREVKKRCSLDVVFAVGMTIMCGMTLVAPGASAIAFSATRCDPSKESCLGYKVGGSILLFLGIGICLLSMLCIPNKKQGTPDQQTSL